MDTPDIDIRSVRIDPVGCIRQSVEMIKDQYWLLLGIVVVGYLLGSMVPFGILMAPLMCGIYMCFLKKLRGERASFDILFKGFDHFGQSLLVMLINMAIFVPAIFAMYIGMFVMALGGAAAASGGDGGEAIGVAMVLMLILVVMLFSVFMLVISMLFMFAFVLIPDKGLSAVEAIKASAKGVFANFGGLLVLMILAGFIGVAGMLLCCVGGLFLAPVIFGAYVIAYSKIFPDPRDLGEADIVVAFEDVSTSAGADQSEHGQAGDTGEEE